MKFGTKIKTARQEAGLTQEQLGIRCGWTNGNPQSRVGNYEKDVRAPSAADLLAISEALNINILYFYDQSDLGNQPKSPDQGKLSIGQIELLREIILQTEKITIEERLTLNAQARASVIAAGFAACVSQNLSAKDINSSPDIVLTAIYTAIQSSSA